MLKLRSSHHTVSPVVRFFSVLHTKFNLNYLTVSHLLTLPRIHGNDAEMMRTSSVLMILSIISECVFVFVSSSAISVQQLFCHLKIKWFKISTSKIDSFGILCLDKYRKPKRDQGYEMRQIEWNKSIWIIQKESIFSAHLLSKLRIYSFIHMKRKHCVFLFVDSNTHSD